MIDKDVLARFDEETQIALGYVQNGYSVIFAKGGDVELPVTDDFASRCTLVFHGASCEPEIGEVMRIADVSIEIADGEYVLHAVYTDEDRPDEEKPFVMRFMRLTCEIEVFDCTSRPVSPILDVWGMLASMAWELKEKAALGDRYLNDGEREIMPLISELCDLEYWDEAAIKMPLLREIFSRHSLTRAEKLTEKLEKLTQNGESGVRELHLFERLKRELSKPAAEGAWREIYYAIAATQKDYAKYSEKPDAGNEKYRRLLKDTLEKRGFSGDFPLFRRDERIRNGVRTTFLIADDATELESSIASISAASVVSGENEAPRDLPAFVFRRKCRPMREIARRAEQNGERFVPVDDRPAEEWIVDHADAAIAVAEGRRLTKEQKKTETLIPGADAVRKRDAVVAVVFIAVCYALAFALIALVGTAWKLVTGGTSDVAEFFRSFDWLGAFIAATVFIFAFPVGLRIAARIANRKDKPDE